MNTCQLHEKDTIESSEFAIVLSNAVESRGSDWVLCDHETQGAVSGTKRVQDLLGRGGLVEAGV